MLDCSFGFRCQRSAHDALQVLIDESWKGRRWVVETDIANCFEAIPHSGLMQAIEERICDRAILCLLRRMRTLIMIAGRRWPVEEDFQTGKDAFGLDHSVAVLPVVMRARAAVMAQTARAARVSTRCRSSAG
jgi:hypothetical protein